MSLNWPKPNHNHASEYQVSGWPYVTSSNQNEIGVIPVKISFPYVTQWIQVFNTDPTDTLRVAFTQNGANQVNGKNYLILSGNQATERLELRCTELWFRQHGSSQSSFSVIAGLTNSNGSEFPIVTGSNGFDGVG
jgi:hypothetical protein